MNLPPARAILRVPLPVPGKPALLHVLALLLIAMLTAPAALAEISRGLAAEGWEEITFKGYIENEWSDIEGGVRVVSDGGISIIFRRLDADLANTPILTWRWRIDNAPVPTDLSKRSGEDRALSLYVGFPHEPDRATLGESLRYNVVRIAQGAGTPGRILSFAWGGMRPRGSLLKRNGTGALQILRTPGDAVDVWLEERVDVFGVFREAFGWEPPNPTHIGITSDSDDTGRAIDAMVVDIEYIAR